MTAPATHPRPPRFVRPPPPPLQRNCALFLDIDGTLAEFAKTPDAVRIDPAIFAVLPALRRELDFPGRVKGTVMKHPAAWIGGATLFGMLLSKLPARRKKIFGTADGKSAKFAAAGRTGLVVGSLKIAFDLARPALAKWAGQRVADYMDGAKSGRRPPA